jgi:hypothetical protein
MRLLALTLALFAATLVQAQERTPSPPGAEVYIISPKDGATLTSPVHVQFGRKGMGAPLAASDRLVHFGKGQTETLLPLTPGRHTLQLLLGDQNHIPHDPPMISKKITITIAK